MSSRRAALLVLLLTALALGIRSRGIDFGLPHWKEPDANLAYHVDLLRHNSDRLDRLHSDRQYPHLVARLISLWPEGAATPEQRAAFTREQHLAEASKSHVQVRFGVALLSILIVPATYLLARRFLGRGASLFAALLVAGSLLDTWFAQQARPHAAAASFVAFAVLAAMRLARKPTTGSYVLAGVAAALALGSLQSGLAVLPPLLVAHLVRDESPRRFFSARAFVALAILALSIPLFYPFSFTSDYGSDWGRARIEGGKLIWADHVLALSDFDGRGFRIVGRTLLYYEPALLVLVALAAVACLLPRLPWAPPRDPGKRRELLVVLAFAVPYLAMLGLFANTYERFLLPLLPFLALFAAWGVASLVARVGADLVKLAAISCAAALALVSLGLSLRLAWIREQPDTMELAARWIEAREDPARARIFLSSSIDLPLCRSEANLRKDGKPRPNLFGRWANYQANLPEGHGPPPLFSIEWLLPQNGLEYKAIADDPASYLAQRGPGLYVIEVLDRRGHRALRALQDELRKEGKLEVRISPDDDPHATDHPFFHEDELVEDWPNVACRMLHAHAVGPVLEIYRLGGGG